MTIANKVSVLIIGSFATVVTSGFVSYAVSPETKKTDEKPQQAPATANTSNSAHPHNIGDWALDWGPDGMGDLI